MGGFCWKFERSIIANSRWVNRKRVSILASRKGFKKKIRGGRTVKRAENRINASCWGFEQWSFDFKIGKRVERWQIVAVNSTESRAVGATWTIELWDF